jgi:hypothetical protein
VDILDSENENNAKWIRLDSIIFFSGIPRDANAANLLVTMCITYW